MGNQQGLKEIYGRWVLSCINALLVRSQKIIQVYEKDSFFNIKCFLINYLRYLIESTIIILYYVVLYYITLYYIIL